MGFRENLWSFPVLFREIQWKLLSIAFCFISYPFSFPFRGIYDAAHFCHQIVAIYCTFIVGHQCNGAAPEFTIRLPANSCLLHFQPFIEHFSIIFIYCNFMLTSEWDYLICPISSSKISKFLDEKHLKYYNLKIFAEKRPIQMCIFIFKWKLQNQMHLQIQVKLSSCLYLSLILAKNNFSLVFINLFLFSNLTSFF